MHKFALTAASIASKGKGTLHFPFLSRLLVKKRAMDRDDPPKAAICSHLVERTHRHVLRITLFGIGTSIFLLFSPNASFSDSPGMEIVFLGTGGPRAEGRAASCDAVLINGQPRFFVDVGSGAFTRLGELHLALDKVDTIFLTHLHVDHTADLASMMKARGAVSDQAIHFDIFGPSGAGDYPSTSRFVELLFGEGGAWAYLKHFGIPISWTTHDIPNDLSA